MPHVCMLHIWYIYRIFGFYKCWLFIFHTISEFNMESDKWGPNNDSHWIWPYWWSLGVLTSPKLWDVHGAYERNKFPSPSAAFFLVRRVSLGFFEGHSVYAQLAG